MSNQVILLKSGEIALKGLNRHSFENLLIQNVKRRLSAVGRFSYFKAQSTIYITPEDPDCDMERAMEVVSRVFGVAAYCKALVVEKSLSAVLAAAPDYLRAQLSGAKTFKVETRRSDKQFPLKSPELSAELGGVLLEAFPNLSVNVSDPEIVVFLEIREKGAYLYAGKYKGAGGIPVGSSGKAALLISGGIDSPVAGYMLAKRGVELIAIHFESPPYTSERARDKVFTLLQKITPYTGQIRCFVVPFTDLQTAIKQRCPEDLFTIIMRRVMMQIAQHIANANDAMALITGESVGQVASQTLHALACTDAVVQMPVFRPVIGMDKAEIVEIAKRIDTFDTSILPYEDCCTVFTPKHPRTKPKMEMVLEAEVALEGGSLIEIAIENTASWLIRESGWREWNVEGRRVSE